MVLCFPLLCKTFLKLYSLIKWHFTEGLELKSASQEKLGKQEWGKNVLQVQQSNFFLQERKYDHSTLFGSIILKRKHKTHKMKVTVHKRRQSLNFYLLSYECVLSCFSHVQVFVTLWTVAQKTSLSIGFSRQEYCAQNLVRLIRSHLFVFYFHYSRWWLEEYTAVIYVKEGSAYVFLRVL